MNYLNGGYVMLDKADSDIFAKASGALQAGKPILWYEDKNTCYFIDTIEKTGSDSIALTKGGLTIVITSGNVVSENGSIKPKLYEYIINDSDVFGVFYSDVNLADINISSSATELTNDDKVALTKLYNYVNELKTKRLIIASISDTDSWINSKITVTATALKLEISLNAVDATDVTSLITGSYEFTVSDGAVTAISAISDSTFDDAFALYKNN